MVLHDYVKQCNMWFLLGEGGISKKFANGPTKWSIPKFLKNQNIWDAPQLIELINMNHNKYLRSSKRLSQK
jgi:hypothetical protein